MMEVKSGSNKRINQKSICSGTEDDCIVFIDRLTACVVFFLNITLMHLFAALPADKDISDFINEVYDEFI